MGTILGNGPAYVSIESRSGKRAIQALWGGTMERSIAQFIRGARHCRLPFESLAGPGEDFTRLTEYQYVQGCLLFVKGQSQPVVFAVLDMGKPKVLMEAR
jgi:hypothetical protein